MLGIGASLHVVVLLSLFMTIKYDLQRRGRMSPQF